MIFDKDYIIYFINLNYLFKINLQFCNVLTVLYLNNLIQTYKVVFRSYYVIFLRVQNCIQKCIYIFIHNNIKYNEISMHLCLIQTETVLTFMKKVF